MPTSLPLYIGTSGWSYRWKEIFYPEELKSADYLAYYANHYNCTEINSSFYHYTMPRTIEKWLAGTPAHFKFAPKLHQEITHTLKWQGVEESLEKFMGRYLLMGERLGPVLVQIAASFRYDQRVAEDFFRLLRDRYPSQVFALEARHVSWFGEEVQDQLRDYQITWVIASAGKRFPSLQTTTSNTVYLRLHGEERLYASAYSEEQLERYAFMVQDWLQDGKQVWVFFNNTMYGSAVLDSKKLQEMVARL
jgi:uncharacterized protein YecE (DUF72 family)